MDLKTVTFCEQEGNFITHGSKKNFHTQSATCNFLDSVLNLSLKAT